VAGQPWGTTRDGEDADRAGFRAMVRVIAPDRLTPEEKAARKREQARERYRRQRAAATKEPAQAPETVPESRTAERLDEDDAIGAPSSMM
jgi:hypothetical protein